MRDWGVHLRLAVLGATSVAAIAFAAAPGQANEGPGAARPLAGAAPGDMPLFAPGQAVVRYDADTAPGKRATVRADVGAERAIPLEVSRSELVELPDDIGVRAAVAELEADPAVEFAEPNYLYETQSAPNDTFFSRTWGLDNTGQTVPVPTATGGGSFAGTADVDIDAPEGWEAPGVENGDASDVVVAIVDTGIDYEHPDLAPNMWENPDEIPGNSLDDDSNGFVDDVHGADFKSLAFRPYAGNCDAVLPPDCADSDPIDDTGSNHGTHVAGTVGARGGDGYGVSGVAQKVQLMAVKVFDALDRSSSSSVGNAFAYAGDEGADVVNASLGGPCPSQLQATAIEQHPEVLFVISASNGGDDGVGDNNDIVDDTASEFSPSACGGSANTNKHPGTYPCNMNDGPEAAGFTSPAYDFPNVVCVASMTSTGAKAGSSNYGPTAVQVAAPGAQVLSTQPDYETLYEEGAEDSPAELDGRLIDQASTPITSATATGWRPVAAARTGSFAMSESAIGEDYPNTGGSSSLAFEPAAPIDLTGETGCHVEWFYGVQAATSADGVQLQIGTGPSHTGLINIGEDWSSTPGGNYVQGTAAVPELNGEDEARYRVSFVSNGDGMTAEGSKVDDIAFKCLGGDHQPDEVGLGLHGTHKFFSGTSMAAPHVAGAAALILAEAPGLAPEALIERLMDSGDDRAAFATGGGTPIQSGRSINLDTVLDAPPAVEITKKPPKKTKDKKVTIKFSSDEPQATLTCELDREPLPSCDSPLKVTARKKGKHEFAVAATDAAGNASSDEVSWKRK